MPKLAKFPRIAVTVTVVLAVLLGVCLAQRWRDSWRPTPSPEAAAKPHLDWAERESQRIISVHLHDLDTFFAEAKKNTPHLAARVLGYRSKWLLVKDRLPFTEGKEHEGFLRETFHACLFEPEQLEDRMRQVVMGYLQHVRSIEGQMLVNLRMDIADLPSTQPLATVDAAQLEAHVNAAITNAMGATGTDLQADLANQIVAVVVGEALTSAAIRLGLSGGILGTGAASSWATVGISVVVCLIVDYIVSWVWDWWADPQGELAAQLNQKLDELQCAILDGSGSQPGLRDRLAKLAQDRAMARSAFVLALLHRPGGAQ